MYKPINMPHHNLLMLKSVKVPNTVRSLLPHFYFTGVHFRTEFYYVGHLGKQKIAHEPVRTPATLRTN